MTMASLDGSAYPRATLKVMESLRRAQRLRELQASNHRRLAEQVSLPMTCPS
jgi:hypothetical protein